VNKHVAFLRAHRKQQTDCWWYEYLIPNFVIAVEECGKVVMLLNINVGGKVITLSPANLDNLCKDYKPSHSAITAVCHGGHNILYGKFA